MITSVGKSIKKLDSEALITGKPVYTEDLEPANALVVKLLRSPHAHASILSIDKEKALKVAGIEGIYTYEDVPKKRFTLAGQSYPEPSPYDRLILDQTLRYVGDEVCIVAGTSHASVDKALKLIKVSYDIHEPVLDYEKAIDHPVVVHSEEDYHVNFEIGNQVLRNICAGGSLSHGDVDAVFEEADVIVEHVFRTKANNQGMMESFKTYTTLDVYGRLTIVSSTQVPFHVRRHVAHALEIPTSQVKVIKPRIGGGFGAKQTLVTEMFPAFVTMKTGKPAKLYYSRKEAFTASTSRHAMTIKVKVGAKKDGTILGIQMNTLSNTGAYGEHGPTTVGLTASKTISLYNKAKAFKFDYQVVYTNTMSAGAFRGYGATQGAYALESAVNELAAKLNMDPVTIRLKNLLEEGEVVKAYYNETIHSCRLRECISRGKEMIGWDDKYPSYKLANGNIRAYGMAISMQGSGISAVDIASVRIHLNDNGFYTLMIGATDLGTGCDTILAQIAADGLSCSLDTIIVHGVDTDISPYDTGSYASSTTYVTGGAVVKACVVMKEMILQEVAKAWKVPIESLTFDGASVFGDNQQVMTLKDLANRLSLGDNRQLVATGSNSMDISPPPFMVGFVEIEADPQTMAYKVVDYVAVVDCGTVINPALAKIQVEGGIAQGIGMAMSEDIHYNSDGRMFNDSFMLYKMPSRLDVGKIRVDFKSSYEPSGPYGAKSIGEIVINTPSPAIAHAVNNAFDVWIRELPITPQKIFEAKMVK
jgi:CO/xanthine dehydrogenase Mo-binding subunit